LVAHSQSRIIGNSDRRIGPQKQSKESLQKQEALQDRAISLDASYSLRHCVLEILRSSRQARGLQILGGCPVGCDCCRLCCPKQACPGPAQKPKRLALARHKYSVRGSEPTKSLDASPTYTRGPTLPRHPLPPLPRVCLTSSTSESSAPRRFAACSIECASAAWKRLCENSCARCLICNLLGPAAGGSRGSHLLPQQCPAIPIPTSARLQAPLFRRRQI